MGAGAPLIGSQSLGTTSEGNLILGLTYEYNTLEDGTELNPEAVQNSLPIVMKDKKGNRWDLFGYAVEGPRKGERLTPTLSYTGYWFAWADFFPRIEIHHFN